MPTKTKGHGNVANHGHGHSARDKVPLGAANRRQGQSQVTASRQMAKKPREKLPEGKEQSSPVVDVPEMAVMEAKEETVFIPYDIEEEERRKKEEEEKQEEERKEEERKKEEEEKKRIQAKKDFKKCNVTPENFNVKEFNTNMSEFVRTLEQPRYALVDTEYPVEELVSVVGMVNKSVNDYRHHTSSTQHQLEDLREAMRNIKENLHFSVSREAMDLGQEEEHQTQEEKDLHARLTHLNAAIAQANADVTEALRLATETESTAVKANIAAEKAKVETQRIQEEIEKKEKEEKRRQEEEKKRAEEEKRRREEEERKIEEEQRRMDEEWRMREEMKADNNSNIYDSWTPVEFEHTNENGDKEITCIARGQPGSIDSNHVTCRVASEKEALVTYLPNEELISSVVDLTPENGEPEELKDPIYVAIPHVMSRSSAQSREAVIKAMVEGQWMDLPTRDVTFDTHKDTKFAQAEVNHLTTLVVMSRYKRDYITLDPAKSHKVISSVDHRITLTMDEGSFGQKQHFLLEVQPVDSATVQEFRTRQPHSKGLLTCSSIVHTQWESSLWKPVEVTLTCPPNPAKAKKMAMARKLKEEKMKQPPKPPVPLEELERQKEMEKAKEKKRLQEFMEEEEGEIVKPTKWYMGEYANTDDDETDRLHFVYLNGGKWACEPDMKIKQIKLDVVGFTLGMAVDKFMVLRTRTSVDQDTAVSMAISLNEYLSKRFVEALVRQRSDNPFEVALQITPVSRVDAVVKQFAQQGFQSGPAPSHMICLHEGDKIELGFSGNIECMDEVPDQLVYKSNVPTVTYFTVKEENRFRQKDHEVFSGLLVLTRLYHSDLKKPLKFQGQGQEEELEEKVQWKRERLCALQINIPKYHIEPNKEPNKAPVVLPRSEGPVNKDLLMTVAESLGEEWKRVAHYLGVHRARVQAIIRNVTVGDRSETEAKFDMLVTWLKGAAKALDKVSALSCALMYSERADLAEMVQEKGREYEESRRG